MIYDSALEKAAIVPRQEGRRFPDESLAIKNCRRKVIVLVSFELLVMVIYLTLQVVIFIVDHFRHTEITRGTFIESFITLISTAYLIVFIIMFIRYFPVGILIFAWLTLIQLIGGSFLLILAIMALIYSLSTIQTAGVDIIFDISFSLIGIATIILSVLILLHSLTLLKLMKR